MDMMISARPESLITIMITQETQEYDAKLVEAKNVAAPEMKQAIKDFINKYQIKTISVYGPRDFINHLSTNIETNFNYTVKRVNIGE